MRLSRVRAGVARRSVAAVLAAAVPTASAAAQAPPARAFVRLVGAAGGSLPAAWRGEAVTIAIEVGVDREWFAAHAVQLFRQPLDVPVQVVAPWFDGAPGFERLPDPARPGAAATIAVNGAIASAERLPDERLAAADASSERLFAVLRCARRLCASEAGELALSPLQLRFAHATAFRDDLVNGRAPVDRTDVAIDGPRATLSVRALPTSGRPAEFGGAVGRFTIAALATPSTLAVGERLRLELTIRGDGNLRALRPPSLGALQAFHELGVLDRPADDAHAFTFELAPLAAGTAAVPRVPFAFFDPVEGVYRTIWTEPLPVQITAGPAGGTASAPLPLPTPPDAGEELADIRTGALPRDVRAPPAATVATVLLAPWLTALAWWALRRGRPAATRSAEHAFAAFVQASEQNDVDLAARYDDYLAVRFGVAAAADGASIEAALTIARLPADLRQRAVRLRQSLHTARYGGVSAAAAAAAQQLVRELERARSDAEVGP